ncbi:MAG: hemin uptake protein HemP [Pseudorhodoplanes sp.]|jgi:hemin uptake protein HemP|nr:hemin uptake protein HemP [Pseudorhodoplanes sp.]
MNADGRQDDRGITRNGIGANPDSRREVAIVDHRIDSRDLFVATREVTIAHGDDVYRLRLTAQNKLILTK